MPEQLRMTVKHAYPGASSWSWPVAWLSSIGTVEQPHQHIFGVGQRGKLELDAPRGVGVYDRSPVTVAIAGKTRPEE